MRFELAKEHMTPRIGTKNALVRLVEQTVEMLVQTQCNIKNTIWFGEEKELT